MISFVFEGDNMSVRGLTPPRTASGPQRSLSASAESATWPRCGGADWCTPGMGVSVGVQVPCRRFTFMESKDT